MRLKELLKTSARKVLFKVWSWNCKFQLWCGFCVAIGTTFFSNPCIKCALRNHISKWTYLIINAVNYQLRNKKYIKCFFYHMFSLGNFLLLTLVFDTQNLNLAVLDSGVFLVFYSTSDLLIIDCQTNLYVKTKSVPFHISEFFLNPNLIVKNENIHYKSGKLSSYS